ncbi:MAG: L,D-transpeptidase [Sciscionella sp.]
MSVRIGAACGLALSLLLAGCAAGNGHPHAHHSVVHQPVPAVSVTPLATDQVIPTMPIVVRAQHGHLTRVAVNNTASGVTVTGALSPDRTSWTSTEPLGYGASYLVKAAATGKSGQTTQHTATVHTVTPAVQAYPTVVPGPGQSVGVGQPVVVRFSHAVTDRAAALKALHVASNPPQQGAWYWMSNTEVHYRPSVYWQPNTTVRVAVKDYGVNLGNGVYGQTDRAETFSVHDSWIAKADGGTEKMRIYHNGTLVNTMPISLGKGKTPTHSGPHVISDKRPSVVMDSCTYGVCKGQPGYYKETVLLDERISNDGEFVHAAPWSVGQQGSSNVSHGCVNLSQANAQWFYGHFGIGDVVEISNSGGPPLPVWDTYGDWELSWAQWQAGAAG